METKYLFFPARFDACWVVGDVCGSFLSGIVFNSLGYYGTYTVYGFCLVIAIIYLLFAKEPIQRVSTQKYDSKLKLLKRIFVDSVKGGFHLHLLVFPFVYQLHQGNLSKGIDKKSLEGREKSLLKEFLLMSSSQ